MRIGDEIMKVMQEGGKGLPLPSPQDEPPYLSFLRAFLGEVEELAGELELPGKFHWRVVRPLPNLLGVEAWFEEEGGEPTHYLILRGPSFLRRDIVKIEEFGSGDWILMEADPKAVLAYLTF